MTTLSIRLLWYLNASAFLQLREVPVKLSDLAEFFRDLAEL